jgi:Flp pilus assembly pilin Flp
VKARLVTLWRSERGNDIVEYALLFGFICLVGAAMYVGMAGNTKSMWSIVNSRLAANQGS